MSEIQTPERTTEAAPVETSPRSHGLRAVFKRYPALSPERISLVYLYVFAFILFSVWIPSLWLTSTTFQSVLNISFAIPGMAALAILLPMSAGAFDLSIAGVMSASSVMTGSLLAYSHWALGPAIAAGLGIALVAGLLNGILIVGVGINSFIATLGTNAIWAAFADWKAKGQEVTGFPASFGKLSNSVVFWNVQLVVVYVFVIGLLLWYIMEHTPFGRYVQATGDNGIAARLSGIRTSRYVFVTLIVSAVIAGFTGIVEASSINGTSSSLGDSFLLPAFAATFLGATQFKRRANVWGTLAAIWVLGSTVQGVTLAVGSYEWLNNLFFGVALVVAVGMGSVLAKMQLLRATRQRARTAAAHENVDV